MVDAVGGAAGHSPVRAAEQLAARLPPRRLAELAAALTLGYRSSEPVPLGPEEVAAYCAYRFPATYAAARSCLLALAASCPELAPQSLLDLGGGAGASAFAAAGVFGPLGAVTVLDQNEHMLRAGQEIAASTAGVLPAGTDWVRAGLGAGALPPADLVVASYVLGELAPAAQERLVTSMADGATAAVLVVEPGTPAGHGRVLGARAVLLRAGWTVAAPCPHDRPCPMAAPDWCHFSVRIPRSRVHRLAKSADLGYEDEKYSYVAAVRAGAPARPAARVVRHPDWRRSAAVLRLCTEPGALESRTVPKSAGDAYRAARRARWGDPWPPPPPPAPAPAPGPPPAPPPESPVPPAAPAA